MSYFISVNERNEIQALFKEKNAETLNVSFPASYLASVGISVSVEHYGRIRIYDPKVIYLYLQPLCLW